MLPEVTTPLIFFVNGKKVTENNANPEWTLVYYLRNKRLPGTKVGCSEGGCGACTVMVSKYDRQAQRPQHYAINSCLAPACSMHGLAVTTVEGIGSTLTKLHPAQERIAKAHGSQCGFCTPGMVMSMYTVLRNSHEKPSVQELGTALQGNLCRCTGYRPIIEGYKTFTRDGELRLNGNCGLREKCCKIRNDDEILFDPSEFAPYDRTQEPIFPPELKLNDVLDRQNLIFKTNAVVGGGTWYRPTDLKKLLELKREFPDAKIVVGNTRIGIDVKFGQCDNPVVIHPECVHEMTEIVLTETGIKFGAAVTLAEVERTLNEQINSLPRSKTRLLSAIVEMLQRFAGQQIRNVVGIGSNVMTPNSLSDLNLVFIAAEIEVELQNTAGKRVVVMDGKFFDENRKTIVRNDEVLVSLTIPYTRENQYVYAYKQARKRDNDVAIVNFAINLTIEPHTRAISKINLAFGGMAPTIVTAPKTSTNLIGLPWNEETLNHAYACLMEDLPLPPNAPGGMVQYRRSLTLSLFFKAFLTISQQLQVSIDANQLSAIENFPNSTAKSSQYYHVHPNREKTNTVGLPLVHAAAFQQATGEAVYLDDMPTFSKELCLALVFSSMAHAEIIAIDPEEALKMDGVRAFFSAKDLPAERNIVRGPLVADEEIFASKFVTCNGLVIGAIVAEDRTTARKAARKVRVTYQELAPVILTIPDAIKRGSFHGRGRKVETGDVDGVFKTAPHIVEGECRNGAQEHFYLETNCAIALPRNEDSEMEIFSASQNPSGLSKSVAFMLGVPENRIIARVKRLGGGFGGKETKSLIVALPTALAAARLRRPVRCVLDRDEDMTITGTRHPFYTKHKTAFDDAGNILASEIHIYANGGCSTDLSPAVMDHALLHVDNAYKIPNARVIGRVCKTNLPSNTAFRGFGAPQAMLAAEFMIRQVAEYLNKDPLEVMAANFYKEGDVTFYNAPISNCTMQRCVDECTESSRFYARRKAAEEFNKQHRWKKRGISFVPLKHGIGISPVFLNHGAAFVVVYLDGSVLLSHGGTEMGQGLHTKMLQIASRVLEVAVGEIHITETSTNTIANAIPTVASTNSDFYGMAVMNACQAIRERIEPFRMKNPKGNWKDWVLAAYVDRVCLSATGFYKTPDVGYDWETNTGLMYNYFTYGAACSEVEIDCLTGDHKVFRTDIVMDIGESLNPAIDIGQIEGAFMQGYGLFLIEEMLYSPKGILHTKGSGTYKIPGFSSIPTEFNVSLLKGSSNPRAVYSSKGVGEPPLFLASSILFAVREAIKSARIDAGVPPNDFNLDAPATSAKIRMACEDHLTAKLDVPEADSFTPWNVIP